MTPTLADRVSAIHEAERHLRAMTPLTEAWLDAQRAVVRARAAYWDAMTLDWDLNHPGRTDAHRPVA